MHRSSNATNCGAEDNTFRQYEHSKDPHLVQAEAHVDKAAKEELANRQAERFAVREPADGQP